MGLATLTNFIIALIVISIIGGVFGIFVGNMNDKYSTDANNMTYGIDTYNELSAMTNITRDLQNNITRISEPTGILDKIGGLFASGYNAMLIMPKSFDVFESMLNTMLKDTVLGEYTNIIKNGIIIIVLITIFVGGILAIIVKG